MWLVVTMKRYLIKERERVEGREKKASLLASHGTAAGTERGKDGGGYGRIVITSNCLV